MSSSRRPSSGRPTTMPRSRNGSNERRSKKEEEELVYECKAAYLVVVDDTSDDLQSKDQLRLALQQSGRNVSTKVLNKHWPKGHDSISFDDFLDICRSIPVTSEDDLIKAFRKMDLNGDGYITNRELLKVMTTRGEKMTKEEVQSIIDEVDENGDGKLDYKEFCKMMLNTQQESMKVAKKRLERKEKDKEEKRKLRPDPLSKGKSRSPYGASKKKSDEETDDDDDIVIGSQVSLTTPRPAVRPDEKPPKTPTPKPRRSKGNLDKLYITTDSDEKASPRGGKERVKSPIASKRLRLPEPKRLKDWNLVHRKGCFFFEEDGDVISHQYSLRLPEDTSVWITIEPLVIRPGSDLNSARGSEHAPVDTMLYVLRDRPDQDGNSLVTVTEQRDNKGKYCVRCDMSKGTYQLIPFTSGCRFQRRKTEPKVETKLIKKDKDDKYVLTKAFKEALVDIFEMSDLDGNGLLNREEFNWFNLRTSGEEVADEEWEVVEENVELKNGELTRKGFIDLNQMEADDNQGDTDDLWMTLTSMGYNKGLILDESCPFIMEVYVEDCDPTLKIASMSGQSNKLRQAMCQSTIDKGEASKVKNMKDLYLHTYMTDFQASLVVENKSRSQVKMSLDCSKSRNCATHRDDLEHKLDVPAKSTVMGHILMPVSEEREWSVRCVDAVVSSR